MFQHLLVRRKLQGGTIAILEHLHLDSIAVRLGISVALCQHKGKLLIESGSSTVLFLVLTPEEANVLVGYLRVSEFVRHATPFNLPLWTNLVFPIHDYHSDINRLELLDAYLCSIKASVGRPLGPVA